MRSSLLLLAVAAPLAGGAGLAACAEPTSLVVHIAPAPAPTTPAPGSKAPAAIVWVHRDEGIRSLWLEEAEGGPTVRLERGEPVIATAAGLYAYRTREASLGAVRGCGCDPAAPGCEKAVTATEAIAVHLGTGRVVPIAAPGAPEACDGLAEYAGDVSLAGSAGALVFAGTTSEESCCTAAHPIFHAAAVAFDLERLAPVSFSPPKTSLPRLAKRAREQLLREAAGCLTDASEAAELFASRFEYDETGRLVGRYTFTMSAAYACGTGPGHYSVATDVIDPMIPDDLDRLRAAPAWIEPWLQAHPIVGLSVLPPPLDRLAAFRQMESIVKR
jgi:hypothetical protein